MQHLVNKFIIILTIIKKIINNTIAHFVKKNYKNKLITFHNKWPNN